MATIETHKVTAIDIEHIDRATKLLDICATYKPYYICCKVHVLRTVQNCPYKCCYCFLQEYLTDKQKKKLFINKQLIFSILKETLDAEPRRLFRIGTWELGDSLALDGVSPQVVYLVELFSGFDNAVLELKTKSARIEPLIGLKHNRKTVVSWSMTPHVIAEKEEKGTATAFERIHAMSILAQEGYLIGIHFDPLLYYPQWESIYQELIEQIFDKVPSDAVAWVSIGTLRFAPALKRYIMLNHPQTRILQAEMIRASDGKMRYPRPLRVEMYRFVYKHLKRFLDNDCIVYLCMEKAPVWAEVFGSAPMSSEELDKQFAINLKKRFSIGP